MKKVVYLSLIFLISYQFSNAQCPVAPRYLNASDATDSGFTFVWNQLKPSCDSVFGFEIGIKPAGGSWAYYGLDSLVETEESDWPFGLNLGTNGLTVGTKYSWKMRTWTDKGGVTYSPWVNGIPFTPADPVATGNCMPPSALCLFTPGATTVTCIWEGTAGPWNAPTRYQFETQTEPTGTWVSTAKAIAGGINATGLTASTGYDWRLRFKCGTKYSKWVTGPDFTTAAGLTGKSAVSGIVMPKGYLTLKSIKHDVIDEEEMPIASSVLQVYPNPAVSQLHVQIKAADLKSNASYSVILKDINGRVFYNGSGVNASALANLSIDVSRMPTGFYMLQITGSDNSVMSSKVNISRE